LGGNNIADVQRLTIVADPSNANGSALGGIRAGNAVFSGSAGVVGISAANVQVQDTVVIGDINSTSLGIPTLTFGNNSNFSVLRVAGGDLVNGQSLVSAGIRQINFVAGTDSGGRTIPIQGLDNKGPTAVSFSNTVTSLAEDASTASRVKVADIAIADDGRGTNSLALGGADASKFELVGNALFLKAGTALNFEAQTSYAVTVSASDSTTSAAAVSQAFTLGVTNVNEAPTITSSGSVSTVEDTAIAFTVVGADVDAGTTLTYTAGAASKGTITGGTNGAFTYTPNANANGADSFVVTVSDGKLSTTQTVNVAITATNDAPVAVADAATSVVMGNAATINVLANDTDVDGNALSISGTPTATIGTVSVVDGALRYVAPANFIGSATISYSITDGTATVAQTQTVNITQPTISRSAESVNEGGSATFTIHGAPSTDYAISLTGTATPGTDYAGAALAQVTTNASGVATFTLAPGRDKATEGAETVIGSIVGFAGSQTITIGDTSVDNVAPAFSSSDTQTATEDTVRTFSIAASDANAEDTVAYSLGAVVGGTATLSGTTVTFTPTANFNGAASVVVNATDGTVTTSQTVAVTVAATNDAPSLAAIADQAGTEDTVLTFNAVGSDIDAGDTLTYSVAGATKGSATVAADGTVTYTPTANLNGADTLTVTVTDASGAVATRTVAINLAASNDAPTFAAATATASPVSENIATTTTVFTAAGSDIDGNTLTYTLGGADAASFAINGATGAVTFAASPNFEVKNSYSFDVIASDGTVAATQSVTLAVTNVNESPALTVANNSVTIDENTIATTTFSTVDPEGDGVSYSLTGLDAALFQIVGNKLSFIAAPNYEVPTDANRDGIYSVTIVATDSAGLASTASVVVTVANVVENNSFTLSVGANDVNAININERVTIDGSITNSFQAIDTIRGGSGTDTLTVQLDGATMRADMTGVENLITTNSNNASTLNMVDVTGLTSITQLAGNAATTYNNLANIVSLTMDSTTTDVAVNYADAALAAAGDNMTVTLSSATAGTITVGRAAGATNALSSVSLVSETLPNTLTALAVTGAGVSTVNISGSQNLNIVGALENGITTVAAGTATGAITLATGAAGVALTTGSGADVLTGGAGADVISSGDGNDVIVASAGNDVINAGDGNDAVQFTAALFEGNSGTTATYAGGAGTNTIAVTQASLAGTDADFADPHGRQHGGPRHECERRRHRHGERGQRQHLDHLDGRGVPRDQRECLRRPGRYPHRRQHGGRDHHEPRRRSRRRGFDGRDERFLQERGRQRSRLHDGFR
jgi:VCBS repeat-containing protein